MKNIVVALIAFALGAVAAFQILHLRRGGVTPPESESAEPGARTQATHAESVQMETSPGGETLLKISTNAQTPLRLEFATVSTETVEVETRAFGHVLDPAPLAALVVEQASAVAASDATTRELARIRTLFAQNQNASARALETAEAAARRDELLLEHAKLKLSSSWGAALAERPDLPELVRRLARQQTALIRLDLPLGETIASAPKTARVSVPGAQSTPFAVTVLGPAPAADPQTQGRGFLVLAETNSPPPGTAVIGWLPLSPSTANQVLVPRSALLRHEGKVFVEVRRDPEHFERCEIELDRPWKDGWLVRDGLKGGESIVVRGAQQLLSTELKAGGGEE